MPMSDERIAELFPEPQLAAYVRGMRDRFYLGYQEWKRNQMESSKGPEHRGLRRMNTTQQITTWSPMEKGVFMTAIDNFRHCDLTRSVQLVRVGPKP